MSEDLVPILEPLLKLMSKHDLLELEVAREGMKIRLKKKYEGVRKEIVTMPGQAMPAGAAVVTVASGESDAAARAQREGLVTITSPMVGTFYSRPSPDADPFVEVGAEVNRETPVCIIEAMKVMNQIKAECEGEVVEVLVQNGHPVEYNQPLFLVRPRA